MIKETIIALSLAFGMMFNANCTLITQKPKKMEVYNQEKDELIQREKGLAENVLKVLKDSKKPFLELYSVEDKDMLDFYERAEYDEQNTKFTPASQEVTLLGNAMSMKRVCENLILFQKLKSGEEQNPKYDKIKEFLSLTDSVCKNVKGIEKVVMLYTLLSDTFDKRERTKNISRSLTELFEHKGGDCNDLTPAYSSFFQYYGINCSQPIGNVESKEASGGHIWLRVKVDGLTFDLDPTWYLLFAPLEPRLRSFNNSVYYGFKPIRQ